MRGRREGRVSADTHGPRAVKKARGRNHRFGRITGLPCATVLTLISRSPRGPGLFAPVIARFVTAQLDASVGAPGPHDFTSAIGAVRPREALARVAKASIASRA